MSDPVFHLSGIVRSRGKTEDFEGPLSLILLLLSKNRIEIRDIKISLILDQYMEYLRRMEEMDLEVASEFVAMASHLAYIKSRMLVAPEGEEISELEELIQGLERLRRKDDYEKIRAVTGQLERMYRKGAGFIEKPPEPLPSSRDYRYRHEPEQLIQAMTELLSREDRIADAERALAGRYPQKVMFPVERKAEEILEKLRTYGT
ncbi:MAG: segregation/condensation protein A, partial [Oscillospiraceae bacterium]|nr:segregation/condensation protein A [Oscillospiraceae bacterium]